MKERMIDIGQSIKEELQRQERTVYWLAQKLGMNRSVLYNNLEKTSIDTELLRRISNTLHRDFFRVYSDGLGSSRENATDA